LGSSSTIRTFGTGDRSSGDDARRVSVARCPLPGRIDAHIRSSSIA